MARGVNKVILIGNLGKDPDMRHMPSGGAVANLTIATSDQWLDKQSGEKTEKTEWHRVVMFGRLGEIAGEYLRKGSKVYVEGRLQTRKWQDKDGQDRYTTEIVANEMQMLDGKGSNAPNMDEGEPMSGSPFPSNNSSSNSNSHKNTKPPAANNSSMDDFDDDIPF